MSEILKPEDYTEPVCPLCMTDPEEVPVRSIPVSRVMEKLDAYLDKNDMAGAERHLLYWIGEAMDGNDSRGLLSLYNELMGNYRKCGKKTEALDAAQKALAVLQSLQMEGSVTSATTFLNTATVYKAFGMSQEALELYEKTKNIYEKELIENDPRLGGLYNNMALALVDLQQYDAAQKLYQKALKVMETAEHGALECAITYLNMANAVEAEFGLQAAEETISSYLETAQKLLDDPALQLNGYYAFVCDKCAPTFGYYGYFVYENELKERVKKIYEGT